jgi:phosphatidylglycerol:prolipoprotein diacylglycerol transferase
MIPYPSISPSIFRIGPFQIRWYGLMYLLGFLAGYWILKSLSRRSSLQLGREKILDFLTYVAIGLIIGGRLGYVLIYNLSYYIHHPLKVFFIWEGGLSFHGGFIGVLITGFLFCRKNGYRFYDIADMAVIPLPIGIGLGRLGNFINGELFGRQTSVPWCMIFPSGGPVCRHPSQLYESILEGWILFAILFWISRRRWPSGFPFWTFIALYGLFRSFSEFFREPDPQLGLVLGPFSAGQCLSIPMAFIGAYMMIMRLKKGSGKTIKGKEHP